MMLWIRNIIKNGFVGEGFGEERALMLSNIEVLALIQCYYNR